jgi:hypothetical protein
MFRFCSEYLAQKLVCSESLDFVGKAFEHFPIGFNVNICPAAAPSWISDRHKKQTFVEDLPMIIPGQFGFNCPSGFREEAF